MTIRANAQLASCNLRLDAQRLVALPVRAAPQQPHVPSRRKRPLVAVQVIPRIQYAAVLCAVRQRIEVLTVDLRRQCVRLLCCCALATFRRRPVVHLAQIAPRPALTAIVMTARCNCAAGKTHDERALVGVRRIPGTHVEQPPLAAFAPSHRPAHVQIVFRNPCLKIEVRAPAPRRAILLVHRHQRGQVAQQLHVHRPHLVWHAQYLRRAMRTLRQIVAFAHLRPVHLPDACSVVDAGVH